MFETTELLLKQISLGEDSSLELKSLNFREDKIITPHKDGVADEIAAFANSFGGVVILGVDDKKNIVGLPLDKLDLVELWIQEICNDLIKPQLLCRIRKIAIDGKYIIRVDITKSIYVHRSPGGYFQRFGSSKREMSPELLARLFQQRSQTRLIRFDEQAVQSASFTVLKKQLWEKFRSSLSNDEDQQFLLKMKLLTEEDGQIYPTISGILLATDYPDEYISNAFIQAVCYKSKERNAAYQIDATDIRGPLDKQIIEAYHFVNKNMQKYANKNMGRQDIPQYSMLAIFEAIVNAVAHRDYSIQGSKIRIQMFSDRVEIYSPGTIANSMTLESLHLRQSSRNELITSLLAKCPIEIEGFEGGRRHLMDKRGEGVPIILTESEKLSSKKPLYKLIDDTELLLTIYATEKPT